MAEGGSTNVEKEYLQKLLKKAEEHCSSGSSDTVSTLYRNKPSSYFDDIKENHNNIMKPYPKDNGGDPRCPINDRLNGLFFNVTLLGGIIPHKSPFGDRRVSVSLTELFGDTANLYFADFYCKRLLRQPRRQQQLRSRTRSRIHYVTLVLTPSGSDADAFCQQHLLKLNTQDNRYLNKNSCRYKTLDRDEVHVEVMYTEDVDLTNRDLTSTPTIGQGQSTPGGIPKMVGCSICNVG